MHEPTSATAPALRNFSIIAHVDHGKTTLVDSMLQQAGLLAVGSDRVLDSMDLERERGVTIMAKNTALFYRGVKLNIVDTPGHADFGGEVERGLTMVDGVVLLVDAAEGPLPQTRFVLEKALARRLPVVVVVNKVDRSDARPAKVTDEIFDLFIDLGADEQQLEVPVLYAIGRDGRAGYAADGLADTLEPLFDTILARLPAPRIGGDVTQFQAAMLDYDDFVGRLALGRLHAGSLRRGERYALCGASGAPVVVKLTQLYIFEGLQRIAVEVAPAGELVALAGVDAIQIGDTLTSVTDPRPLERILVEEPTVAVMISINTGPFAGRSGDKLTSRQVRARLAKETLHNVSIRVEETDSADTFRVLGRGELQLGILVEMMRREGFELTLSRPEVISRLDEQGKTVEPYERVTIDVPDSMIGVITEHLAPRQGKMLDMISKGDGWIRMIYRVPARGMIGFRGEFLTHTRGLGVLNTLYDGHDVPAGDVARRNGGALVADRSGKVTAHAVEGLQSRGVMFVRPGDEVYEGMIVGEHNRGNDLNVNIVRPRKLTNIRSATAEELVVLNAPREVQLESAIEWIDRDELIEVTPEAIRLRKKILSGSHRSVRRS
jgi:GTP-binding protein